MIQWVYESARRARGLERVIVATDDERVKEAVLRFEGEVMMTSPSLPSGTDRVAAVADQIKADVYVNVQGDEPLMSPVAIERVAELVSSGKFKMGTAMTPILEPSELENPSVVKVIIDRHGRAIYFSRFPIPYSRQAASSSTSWICKKHLGLYAYDRETLFRLRELPPSKMEQAESLEQLRALEEGIAIGVTEVNCNSIGVDTPEDLEKVRRILEAELK